MERREIVSKNAPAPLGPYSQAVAANGFIFVSGQIGIDPASGALAGDIVSQTHRAIKNAAAVLADGGSSLGKVVRADVHLADMRDFAAVNKIYAELFAGNLKPARLVCAAAALPKGALIEISCIALA